MRLFIAMMLLICSTASMGQVKIAWFSTLQADLSEKSGFWKRVHDLVLAASEDLDIDFQIYYSEENYIKLSKQVETVLAEPATRPDGIIFHNYKNTGEFILSKAEQYSVKSLMFNAGFPEHSSQPLKPRGKYRHWVGQILPDDEYAGAELFNQLLAAAKQLSSGQGSRTYPVLAMEGNKASSAYLSRKQGFEKALRQAEQAEFTQYVPADWSRRVAYNQFPTIIRRYPNIKIFWSANDNMALGLMDAARAQEYTPGKDFVIGGVDWLPESFEAIRQGQMSVTIGGHFVDGMWALILLYDYLNGYDFAEQYDTTLSTQMLAVTRALLNKYGDISSKLALTNLRRFDFKSLSRSHQMNIDTYPLEISFLLERL